jgi:hypothetical protein
MASTGVACQYCSGNSSLVWHPGVCPKIKGIEYWPNGTIKKVEFRDLTQE